MLQEKVIHYGTFQLHEFEVSGELNFSGMNTCLKLRTEQELPECRIPGVIYGRLHDFSLVSCVHCVGSDEPTRVNGAKGHMSLSWSVFPHLVLSGQSYFDPEKDRISKVWFSTGDIYRIFDDFDSFGRIVNPSYELHTLLPRTIGDRQIPIGIDARFVYFAGRCTLLEASLPFGKLIVQNFPLTQTDSHGARIAAQIRLQVEFDTPVDIKECLSKVASIGQFLSLVAGRSQSIENVYVEMPGGHDNNDLPLSLYSSIGPQQANGQEIETPSWHDMPLDGVRRADEFRQVIEAWFNSNKHATARARLYQCRNAGNRYDTDRLIAAANMFDLTNNLPLQEIPYDLESVRKDCIVALKALPRSDDRDSAIMALSRIGAPTLMKKVLFRAEVVRRHFPLDNLDKVLRQAVKSRNYFVHGPGDNGFKHAVVVNYTSFLTDTLEFVFAVAELIECGWIVHDWRFRPRTGHHWFSRFIYDYEQESQDLLLRLEKTK